GHNPSTQPSGPKAPSTFPSETFEPGPHSGPPPFGAFGTTFPQVVGQYIGEEPRPRSGLFYISGAEVYNKNIIYLKEVWERKGNFSGEGL
ncbi:hypothetical protein, partial [uncultured Dialister sp.]|uniref:hypothetical protein n=1 Tax=uncultured Dialister sp. TaxID=278064 RepID=UPI00265A6BF6